MQKTKSLFMRKEEYAAYDGLTLIWPCIENITLSMITLLPEPTPSGRIADAIQRAVAAYHRHTSEPFSDWERLAMYCLELASFTASELNCRLSPQDITEQCRRPRRLTIELLADTSKKLRGSNA
ncbi:MULTISPECIES: hypothetical protein [Photorhabdus]|uniref:Uncharacterized protein n=2 Tax=Photorhabdus TaxID=29487 RepID=A0AAW6BMR5_9GAMM|nr:MULTISPECIES: hypothetical protein [Photorhabdus]EYU15101.1 hypothetical protein BA1DRAFT_02371 [Photorhabdus aegyptia]MDB6373945.1 hypothetical protein [Photorhabdus bodei]